MTEQIGFYMDEHVDRAITKGLRLKGVDALTAQDVGLLAVPDEVHLTFATAQGRMIFTQDADFLRLDAGGVEHSGMVYVRQQTSISYIVRGLLTIHELLTPAEMYNRVEYL